MEKILEVKNISKKYQSKEGEIQALKNVSFPDANGTTTYAAEEDVANPNLSFVERNVNYADGTKSAAVAHTSIYANFSKDILPQGTLDVTGILTRYNNAWQLIIRTGSDVKRNK